MHLLVLSLNPLGCVGPELGLPLVEWFIARVHMAGGLVLFTQVTPRDELRRVGCGTGSIDHYPAPTHVILVVLVCVRHRYRLTFAGLDVCNPEKPHLVERLATDERDAFAYVGGGTRATRLDRHVSWQRHLDTASALQSKWRGGRDGNRRSTRRAGEHS